MQVQLQSGLLNLQSKLINKGKENQDIKLTTKETKTDRLTFMQIPSVAFQGRLAIPLVPEKLGSLKQPKIQLNPLLKNESVGKGTCCKISC